MFTWGVSKLGPVLGTTVKLALCPFATTLFVRFHRNNWELTKDLACFFKSYHLIFHLAINLFLWLEVYTAWPCFS